MVTRSAEFTDLARQRILDIKRDRVNKRWSHGRFAIYSFATWLVFFIIGLPDYYQSWSPTAKVILVIAVTALYFPVTIYSLRNFWSDGQHQKNARIFAFYLTLPLFAYDYLLLGLYFDLGIGFVVPYWYLTFFYFSFWIQFAYIAQLISKADASATADGVNYLRLLYTWVPGRQDPHYKKMLLFGSPVLLPFDVYLLKFEPGSEVPPHQDQVEQGRHYRLNLVLKHAASGGVFACENVIFESRSLKVFRPDENKHSVSLVEQGTRYVLSIGWILGAGEK